MTKTRTKTKAARPVRRGRRDPAGRAIAWGLWAVIALFGAMFTWGLGQTLFTWLFVGVGAGVPAVLLVRRLWRVIASVSGDDIAATRALRKQPMLRPLPTPVGGSR